jgi:arabinofuranosyltransferase
MAEPTERPDARAGWLALGAAAVVLVVHSLAYNFVTDDAYISFVYARNLAEHGELSFNLGQPVEGYTSFLWTFVIGLGMVAKIPPEWSSRVLGTACGLATLYLVFRIAGRALGRRSPWAAVPALLLACSSGFACWTSGGLETPLYTLLVTAALDALIAAASEPRALRRIGIWLALASMTRPEGPMVAAVLGAVWIGHRLVARRRRGAAAGRGVRDEAIAALWFVGLWAPWFAWRWWYYGWPFPNTYYVKATGPWVAPELAHQMLDNGLYYVWVWLRQSHVLHAAPLVVLGLVAARPGTPRALLARALAVLSAVYLAYTVSVGGDFMGLHRFILPVFVIAALAVALGAEWLVGALAQRGAHRLGARAAWIAPAVAVVVVGGFAVTQAGLTRASLRWGNFDSDRGIDTPAYLIAYTEDRAAIGRAMAGCFAPDDFSIVGGAGAQPYFGRMRGIDVFGLVSDRIAHDEPRVRARAGHTKFGSDRVLASYDPTLVFSCYQIHRTPESPALPCAPFWLARGFEPVTLHIPGLRQQGEYYTFLARKDRGFACPGRVR